jgi:hypothetical protein
MAGETWTLTTRPTPSGLSKVCSRSVCAYYCSYHDHFRLFAYRSLMGFLHLARYRRSLFDAGLVDPHDTEEDRDEELCLS